MKDLMVKELKKSQESKALAFQHSNSSETSEQAQKEKKKKDRRH